jgi:hypothetical protein
LDWFDNLNLKKHWFGFVPTSVLIVDSGSKQSKSFFVLSNIINKTMLFYMQGMKRAKKKNKAKPKKRKKKKGYLT